VTDVELDIKPRRRRGPVHHLVSLACVLVTLLGVAFLVPSLLGYQRYVITGTSMTGTIDLGSVVFEKVVPVADLEVGDVITYQPPAESGIDHLVTHRIVAIHGDTYRTKGDAVPERDPWTFQLVEKDQPRVAFSVPYVGYAFLALADRTIRMAVISVPAGIIFLIALRQLVQGLRRPTPGAPTTPSSGPSLVGG
jgi:signal peptidase